MAVHGNLKANKLILQGHGSSGQDVTMNVENDEFCVKVNDDVLLSVSKDDENVNINGGLTVEGTINNPALSTLQADMSSTKTDVSTLQADMSSLETNINQNLENINSNMGNIENLDQTLDSVSALTQNITQDEDEFIFSKSVGINGDLRTAGSMMMEKEITLNNEREVDLSFLPINSMLNSIMISQEVTTNTHSVGNVDTTITQSLSEPVDGSFNFGGMYINCTSKAYSDYYARVYGITPNRVKLYPQNNLNGYVLPGTYYCMGNVDSTLDGFTVQTDTDNVPPGEPYEETTIRFIAETKMTFDFNLGVSTHVNTYSFNSDRVTVRLNGSPITMTFDNIGVTTSLNGYKYSTTDPAQPPIAFGTKYMELEQGDVITIFYDKSFSARSGFDTVMFNVSNMYQESGVWEPKFLKVMYDGDEEKVTEQNKPIMMNNKYARYLSLEYDKPVHSSLKMNVNYTMADSMDAVQTMDHNVKENIHEEIQLTSATTATLDMIPDNAHIKYMFIKNNLTQVLTEKIQYALPVPTVGSEISEIDVDGAISITAEIPLIPVVAFPDGQTLNGDIPYYRYGPFDPFFDNFFQDPSQAGEYYTGPDNYGPTHSTTTYTKFKASVECTLNIEFGSQNTYQDHMNIYKKDVAGQTLLVERPTYQNWGWGTSPNGYYTINKTNRIDFTTYDSDRIGFFQLEVSLQPDDELIVEFTKNFDYTYAGDTFYFRMLEVSKPQNDITGTLRVNDNIVNLTESIKIENIKKEDISIAMSKPVDGILMVQGIYEEFNTSIIDGIQTEGLYKLTNFNNENFINLPNILGLSPNSNDEIIVDRLDFEFLKSSSELFIENDVIVPDYSLYEFSTFDESGTSFPAFTNMIKHPRLFVGPLTFSTATNAEDFLLIKDPKNIFGNENWNLPSVDLTGEFITRDSEANGNTVLTTKTQCKINFTIHWRGEAHYWLFFKLNGIFYDKQLDAGNRIPGGRYGSLGGGSKTFEIELTPSDVFEINSEANNNYIYLLDIHEITILKTAEIDPELRIEYKGIKMEPITADRKSSLRNIDLQQLKLTRNMITDTEMLFTGIYENTRGDVIYQDKQNKEIVNGFEVVSNEVTYEVKPNCMYIGGFSSTSLGTISKDSVKRLLDIPDEMINLRPKVAVFDSTSAVFLESTDFMEYVKQIPKPDGSYYTSTTEYFDSHFYDSITMANRMLGTDFTIDDVKYATDGETNTQVTPTTKYYKNLILYGATSYGTHKASVSSCIKELNPGVELYFGYATVTFPWSEIVFEKDGVETVYTLYEKLSSDVWQTKESSDMFTWASENGCVVINHSYGGEGIRSQFIVKDTIFGNVDYTSQVSDPLNKLTFDAIGTTVELIPNLPDIWMDKWTSEHNLIREYTGWTTTSDGILRYSAGHIGDANIYGEQEDVYNIPYEERNYEWVSLNCAEVLLTDLDPSIVNVVEIDMNWGMYNQFSFKAYPSDESVSLGEREVERYYWVKHNLLDEGNIEQNLETDRYSPYSNGADNRSDNRTVYCLELNEDNTLKFDYPRYPITGGFSLKDNKRDKVPLKVFIEPHMITSNGRCRLQIQHQSNPLMASQYNTYFNRDLIEIHDVNLLSGLVGNVDDYTVSGNIDSTVNQFNNEWMYYRYRNFDMIDRNGEKDELIRGKGGLYQTISKLRKAYDFYNLENLNLVNVYAFHNTTSTNWINTINIDIVNHIARDNNKTLLVNQADYNGYSYNDGDFYIPVWENGTLLSDELSLGTREGSSFSAPSLSGILGMAIEYSRIHGLSLNSEGNVDVSEVITKLKETATFKDKHPRWGHGYPNLRRFMNNEMVRIDPDDSLITSRVVQNPMYYASSTGLYGNRLTYQYSLDEQRDLHLGHLVINNDLVTFVNKDTVQKKLSTHFEKGKELYFEFETYRTKMYGYKIVLDRLEDDKLGFTIFAVTRYGEFMMFFNPEWFPQSSGDGVFHVSISSQIECSPNITYNFDKLQDIVNNNTIICNYNYSKTSFDSDKTQSLYEDGSSDKVNNVEWVMNTYDFRKVIMDNDVKVVTKLYMQVFMHSEIFSTRFGTSTSEPVITEPLEVALDTFTINDTLNVEVVSDTDIKLYPRNKLNDYDLDSTYYCLGQIDPLGSPSYVSGGADNYPLGNGSIADIKISPNETVGINLRIAYSTEGGWDWIEVYTSESSERIFRKSGAGGNPVNYKNLRVFVPVGEQLFIRYNKDSIWQAGFDTIMFKVTSIEYGPFEYRLRDEPPDGDIEFSLFDTMYPFSMDGESLFSRSSNVGNWVDEEGNEVYTPSVDRKWIGTNNLPYNPIGSKIYDTVSVNVNDYIDVSEPRKEFLRSYLYEITLNKPVAISNKQRLGVITKFAGFTEDQLSYMYIHGRDVGSSDANTNLVKLIGEDQIRTGPTATKVINSGLFLQMEDLYKKRN